MALAELLSNRLAGLALVAIGCAHVRLPVDASFTMAPVCDAARRPAPVDTTEMNPLVRRESSWVTKTRQVPGGFEAFERGARSGRWYIRLVDTTQVAIARELLLQWHDAGELRGWMTRRELESATPRQVTWSLAELHDWLSYLTPRLLGGDLAYGIGISAGNMLKVFVVDERSRAAVEEWLGTLHVPCGLVAIEIGGGLSPAGASVRSPGALAEDRAPAA